MVLLREHKSEDWGMCVTPGTVIDNDRCVWPCTKLPWWLPVPSKHFVFLGEIFRNSICQEVGWLLARLCLACVSWYVGRHRCIAYNFCKCWGANIRLNGLSHGRKPKMWGSKIFPLQMKIPSLRRPWLYSSLAFLTGMWALPLWWAMQPLLRASGKAIRIFSWILPQRKKKK